MSTIFASGGSGGGGGGGGGGGDVASIYRVPTILNNPRLEERKKADPSRPWTRYAMGYPRMAAFMSYDEDRSTVIYRRFERLSARNLLYLETELAELEAAQDRLDAASQFDPDLKSSMQSLEELHMLSKIGTGPISGAGVTTSAATAGSSAGARPIEGGPSLAPMPSAYSHMEGGNQRARFLATAAQARLNLSAKIRAVLREYYEFLKLDSEILALSKPDKRTLNGVRKVFKNERNGVEYGPMISGKMETHLDEQHEKELCVLAPPVLRDRLTILLESRFAFLFRTQRKDGATEFIPYRRIATAVSILSTGAAVLFLIGAIVCLFYVRYPPAQLAIVSCLTVAFAAALGLLTNSRRQEVFAATAAYAAVLVVFVSGNLGSGNNTC